MNARTGAFFFLSTLVAVSAAEVSPVLAPAKRTSSLEQARAAIAVREVSAPEGLKDPFYSTDFAATQGARGGPSSAGPTAGVPGDAASSGAGQAVRPAGPRTPTDLIAALAQALRPSGMFVVRGEPVLTFGQKRVKAGEVLTIAFEGAEYSVIVTAIQPPNFTLRLDQAEFTRSIK